MNSDETRRLLSEYAAGKISEADRRELMRLASEDQAVFEAVLAEQPLAELMADPAARAELRAALAERPSRGLLGRFWRPWPLAAAATAALALFAILVGRHVPLSEKPVPREVAQSRPASAPQSSRELPVRTGDTETANEPAQVAVSQVKNDAAAGLPSKERSKHDVDLKVAANQAVAPKRTAAQAPVPQPEPADAGKEKKSLEQAPAPPAESRVAAIPPSDSREKVVGGIVGGVVGGIVPPREQPTGRGSAASTVPTSRGSRDESLAGMAKAERPRASFQLWKRSADGTYLPVPPETVFRPGDAVQIELTLAASGYVQAAERLPNGGGRMLYPQPGGRHAPLAAGSSVRLPEGGALEIGMPPQDRRIAIFITDEPRPEWFQPGGGGLPQGTAATLEILIRASN